METKTIAQMAQDAVDAGVCEWGGGSHLIVIYGADAEKDYQVDAEYDEKLAAAQKYFPGLELVDHDSGANDPGYYTILKIKGEHESIKRG